MSQDCYVVHTHTHTQYNRARAGVQAAIFPVVCVEDLGAEQGGLAFVYGVHTSWLTLVLSRAMQSAARLECWRTSAISPKNLPGPIVPTERFSP